MRHNVVYYVQWVEVEEGKTYGEHKKTMLCGMEACMNYICDVLKKRGNCSQYSIAKIETYEEI